MKFFLKLIFVFQIQYMVTTKRITRDKMAKHVPILLLDKSSFSFIFFLYFSSFILVT